MELFRMDLNYIACQDNGQNVLGFLLIALLFSPHHQILEYDGNICKMLNKIILYALPC